MTGTHAPPPERQAARFRLAGLVALATFGLWIAHDFIAALAWGLVIAIAIDPLHMRLRARWPGARGRVGIAALITLAVTLVVLVPLLFGLAQAGREAHEAALWIGAARAHGVPPPPWLGRVPVAAPELLRWWRANLADPAAATRALSGLSDPELLSHGRLIGSDVLHRVVVFAFTLLALFFLLRDRDTVIAQLRRAGLRLLGPSSERIGRQAIRSVRGTIDGLVLVGLGEGAVMTVFYLALGTPHPLLLGVLTAVAATIPFGAAVMFLVAAFLLLGQGAVTGAVVVVVAGLVVVAIADHLVRPALIGGATRLPFLWVLIGILGGVETLGILGLFVGPATMAILVMLWRDLAEDGGGASG